MSQINEEEILQLLKVDLGKLNPDENTEYYLRHTISAAKEFIKREGVVLTTPFSVEDAELIKMYAAYMYRKRATPEPMPRSLRWALNNRIFSERKKDDS